MTEEELVFLSYLGFVEITDNGYSGLTDEDVVKLPTTTKTSEAFSISGAQKFQAFIAGLLK